MSPVRIPTATYRLQFHAGFRFTDALALVPHLDTLGVSDIYASPIFCARRGSTHGYDVTDHTRLNPEIGSEEEFTALTDALRGRGMGLVMDIVPNHMGIADESNRWWQDVLENGPSSPHAMCFDIDWHPPKEDLVNKVLLPVLGDQFGRVLENQELQLVYEDETLRIAYHEKRFPVAPRSWIPILNLTIERAQGGADAESQLLELESIVTALGHLPPRTEHDPERIKERLREKEIIRRRLSALLEATATVREAFDAVIRQINGERGSPRSFDVLEGILGDQAYRLSFWRVAAEEINYRRFFDVSDLAAIRVERPEVFEEVHGLAFRLVREGRITGLRIDHPDGLFDPIQYFGDVQRGCRIGLSERGSLEAPGDSSESDERPFWVAVEKILTGEERLSAEWLVHGTTGYDFLNLVNGLFVDPDGARHLRTLWTRFTGLTVNFADLACECRKLILEVAMAGELHVLARRLDRISEQHRWSRDFTFYSLHDALTEVIACFPVYRTYVRTSTTSVGEEDRRHIETAIRSAKRRNPAMSASLFDFIARVLLLEDPEGLSDEERSERREFVMRFQQFTGPVMAKGLEDTTFYRWHPLASLNEVGGQPARLGVSVDEFHRHGAERRRDWPHSLLATSTHDTKRSEDVRARLTVLSEIPHARRGLGVTRRERGVSSLSDPRGRLAPARGGGPAVPRPREELHGEGDSRGEGPHQLDQSQRGARARPARIHRRSVRLPGLRGVLDRLPPPLRADRLGRGDELAGPDAPQDHGARRAGFLPGHRALGFQPRGPGQSPPCEFR
jgi:(1->4)-alpha-D-glucan 1-alpha-D-glucosylmutase